jgi:transmembrane sensor
LDWPLHNGTVDAVLAGLTARAAQRRRGRRRIAAAGCAAAVAILFLAWLRPAPDAGPVASAAKPSVTLTVLTPERQTLADGSVVDLKAGARIETEFTATQRVVTLSRGAAHFQVVTDGRPFLVKAAGVTAQALGTVFLVERDAGAVSVVVTEGRVAVHRGSAAVVSAPIAPSAEPPVLGAGEAVNVTIADAAGAASAMRSLSDEEMREKLSWRLPRLEFSGTPLAEVIAVFNRHNSVRFTIAEPELEKLAVSGILRADRIEALVEMLEADFQLRVERRGTDLVIRKRTR